MPYLRLKKWYYLRSSLSDEATEQIQSLETTDAHYDIAWELLQKRYENVNLIINSYIDAISEIPTMQRESYIGIRHLHTSVEKYIRSLKALGLPVEGWNMVVINIIISKIDPIKLEGY